MKRSPKPTPRTPGTFPTWVGFGIALIGILGARPFVNAAMNEHQPFEQATAIIILFALAITVMAAFRAIEDLQKDYQDAKEEAFKNAEKMREFGQRVDTYAAEIYRLKSLID